MSMHPGYCALLSGRNLKSGGAGKSWHCHARSARACLLRADELYAHRRGLRHLAPDHGGVKKSTSPIIGVCLFKALIL